MIDLADEGHSQPQLLALNCSSDIVQGSSLGVKSVHDQVATKEWVLHGIEIGADESVLLN